MGWTGCAGQCSPFGLLIYFLFYLLFTDPLQPAVQQPENGPTCSVLSALEMVKGGANSRHVMHSVTQCWVCGLKCTTLSLRLRSVILHHLYFVCTICSLLAHQERGLPYTGIGARMSYRKWRESKQQLIWWPDLALLGCCFVSLHFQCILAPITVQYFELDSRTSWPRNLHHWV